MMKLHANSFPMPVSRGKAARVRGIYKVVSGAKMLHHLLPELVFPIDREYTQTFFGWSNPEFQNHPEQCFKFVFHRIAEVAQAVRPASYVKKAWNSSRSKVLDNALVGYCIVHGLESESTKYEKRRRAELRAIRAKLKELGKWDEVMDEVKRRVRDESRQDPSGS
jgi:hypothetical protein